MSKVKRFRLFKIEKGPDGPFLIFFQPQPPGSNHYFRYFKISSDSGVTLLGNEARSFPFSSNKNLVKFQAIVASKTPFSSLLVSHLNKGCVLSPTTSTLLANGKVTPYLTLQNC